MTYIDNPPRYNAALGKTTWHSSLMEDTGLSASSNAVDGCLNTDYQLGCCFASAYIEEASPWIMVDMEEVLTVRSVPHHGLGLTWKKC